MAYDDDDDDGDVFFNGTIASASPPTFTCTNNAVPIKILWPYSTTCTVSSGAAPYTWTISAGTLPAGVTGPSPGTGVSTTLSGAPTGYGATGYTLLVTDSNALTASQTFSGTIAGPTLGTWVSSSGNDINLCTYSSPCRTFAIAIQITLPSGEIDVLDSGDFGPLNITQAVTIDGGGNFGSISNALSTLCSTPTAICIEAGSSDTVTLRNLSLAVSTGKIGILFGSGGYLRVEHVSIAGAPSMLYGVEVLAGDVSLYDVPIQNANDISAAGVYVLASGTQPKLSISSSAISHNVNGLLASAAGAVAQAQNCVFAFNGVAASSSTAATLRLSNNTLMNNTMGLQTSGGGSLITFGNNRILGNTINGNPSGTTTLK